MSTINFRIKQLVDYFASGNNSEFGNLIGVNEANIRNYINGTEPKFSILEKIAKKFEISFEWLLLGIEPMIPIKDIVKISNSRVSYENKIPQVITIDAHNTDNIVLVPGKLKAGYLEGYNDPEFIKTLPAYRMPGLNNGVFRMFEMEGDSMFPTIPNKSYVVGQFVDNWLTGIKDNQVYAVISNEVKDGLLKRCLNRIDKYNNLICKSDNRREYPTQNIDPASIKEIWEVKLHLNFNLPDPADIYDRMNDIEAESQQIKEVLRQLAENQGFNVKL
ncbi:helix-turn-helix domain-containing protein [Chryseobacterium sp. SG20098]|uniref:LexA family transcriptional regulator n=1 Tax=Chryseobacterium sp. SG20098 TaxID=3074145 RepID=UPI00288330F2|nr:helix-turn-helix domain-containing protein [Chryseobacterium sp. SG20098]WNI36686.1 helix-turn-helix domain-containing protein [Chryseobacterium sp. SG20098]